MKKTREGKEGIELVVVVLNPKLWRKEMIQTKRT